MKPSPFRKPRDGRRPPASMRFRLLVGLVAVLVPAIGLLVYQNLYAVSLIRAQAAESYRRLLGLDMDRIDRDLDDADRYLRYLLAANSELLAMEAADDDTVFQLAKIRLTARLRSDLLLYRSVSALVVATPGRSDFLQVFKTGGSYGERQAIRSWVESLAPAVPGPDDGPRPFWRTLRLGKDWYLIRLMRSGGIVIGAWTRLDSLLAALRSTDAAGGGVLALADPAGRVLVDGGPPAAGQAGLLWIDAASTRGDFRLVARLPERPLLHQLPLLQWIIIAVSLGSLAFPLAGLRLLHAMVIRPLDSLLLTIGQIGEGQLERRMAEPAGNAEFARLARGFNGMMDEIDRLKIGIYEEQLDRQREELMRLQAQMNPHFFLNSLNIMYNLVQVKDLALVQELTLCLVAYFRFMVRSESSLIPLGDELTHVRNYHRIQELRFPGRHRLEVDMPEFLGETLVPPLVIQTFVENTVKHASRSEGTTVASVKVDYLAGEDGETVEILVCDNGPGFPAGVLAPPERGAGPSPVQGGFPGNRHIGLANVRRRLAILYGGRASLELSNLPGEGGAAVRIRLPFGEAAR